MVGSTKFLSRKGDKHEKGGDVKMGGLPLLIILYFRHIYGVCGVIFELGELACSNFMYEDEESSAGGSHRLHRSTFGLKQ